MVYVRVADMPVSRQQIIEIKQWLSMRHISVPVEWVEACVTFLVQEYRDLLTFHQRLKSQVYEQWLAADLEEIGVASLPIDLSSCQQKSLDGFFALQVNGMRDVGKPAYSQLRDLEGKTNADAEVSATPRAFVPEWEAKPTRMLILNLTDGVTNVQGMEYRTITSLSPNLPPGVKVLIKGPVECRFGYLLLTADNIEVLGGEVEKYQERFSREQILRDSLQLSSGLDGRIERESGTDISENSRNERSSYNPVQQESFSSPSTRHSLSASGAAGNNNSGLSDVPENFDAIDDDDDFIQDLDYSVLDEIERANSQQNPNPREVENTNAHSSTSGFQMADEVGTFNECADLLHQPPQVDSFSSNTGLLPAPFTYLDSIPESDCSKKEFSITIKGSVTKVVSKLECKAAGGWHLTARVDDSKSSIDVDFHDQVLEELVGVSAKEMMAMQIEARNDARVREKVNVAISSLKKKLQQLHCMMEVKFSPGEKPCVVKCISELC